MFFWLKYQFLKLPLIELLFILAVSTTAFGITTTLKKLPLKKTEISGVDILNSISLNDQYIACKKDLELFVKHLTTEDFNLLKEKNKNISKGELEIIFKHGLTELNEFTPSNPEYDQDLKSLSRKLTHGGFNCQISIVAALEMEMIKSNVDPNAGTLNIKVNKTQIPIEANLIGSSFYESEGKSEVRMDLSKSINLLEQNGFNKASAYDAIKSFQNNTSSKSGSINENTPQSTGVE